MGTLPGLLQTRAPLQKPLARQRLANLMSTLDTLYLVLAPRASNTSIQVAKQYRSNLHSMQSDEKLLLMHLMFS